MSCLLALFSAGVAAALWQPRVPPTSASWILGGAAVCAAALAAHALRFRGRASTHRNPLGALVRFPRLAGWVFTGLRRPAAAARWLHVAAVLAGGAYGCSTVCARWAERLPAVLDGATLTVEGWVADLPLPVHAGHRLLIRTSEMAQAAGVPPQVSILLPDAVARARAPGGGDCLRLVMRLQPVHGELNFSGFDFEGWLWSAGVGASGRALAVATCRDMRAPPQALTQRLRDHIRASLQQVLAGRPAAAIIVALAVGDQSGVTQPQWTLLWRSGIGHLVSISGVHVTLLANLLRHMAERAWRCSTRTCRWLPAAHAGAAVGFLAALAYALVAGFGVPTRRTLYMLAASAVCGWRGVRPGSVRVFWMAVATTLVCDPCAVLSPSFWLSFGAVGGLVLADHGRLQPLAGWRAELAAQWVSNLCLLPFIALWFAQVSLVAPLANLVAIPLVGLVVTPLTLAAMFPGLHGLAVPAEWLLEWLLRGLAWLAAPRWAALDLAAPGALAFTLALAAVAVQLAGRARVAGTAWALPALLPLCLPPAAVPEGALRVEVSDVGQGLAVLVRTQAHLLVFDSGPRWQGGDAGSRTLLPLLRAEGLQHIDLLVLSHPDADHVGGADSLIAGVPVAQVQTGFGRPDSADCLAGSAWDWDGVHFEFLWPPDPGSTASSAHDRNNHACVLRVEAAGHGVLLPADIEAPAERALLADPGTRARLQVDAVVVAHHGSHTSSTADFVAATGARWALVSLGWRNRYHHPDPAVVQRWQAEGAQVLRTDLEGALRLDVGPAGLGATTAREERPAWWRQ